MNSSRPPRWQPPAALVTLFAALLLGCHWWLGVSATSDISATSDELPHVAGGFAYWTFNDYRFQPENGNLPQRLAALPWVLAGARLEPAETNAWAKSNVLIFGDRLFYGPTNAARTDSLLLLSRATMGLVGVALGALIFAWSRRLWGDLGGLFSLSLYAFCPNFLANAPLTTSDVTMTFFFLAACGAFWRHTRVLDGKTAALSVATVALACVAKFSFVLLLPMFGLMTVIRLASTEPLQVRFGRSRAFTTWQGKLGIVAASAGVHVVIAWVFIWACFGFRYSAVGAGLPAQENFFWSWSLVTPPAGFWHWFFNTARALHLLPEAFLSGFATVLYAAAERGAFLNGAYSTTGWPQFFPYTFLVKTTWGQLGTFALMGGVGGAVWRRISPGHARWNRLRSDLYRVAPLAILFGVYWAFSVTSHLNIGHRHILPTYPVLFIGAGLLLRHAAPRWLAATGLAFALGNAAESASIRPHYLAYFNALAGGPENGWRHLVDSSLDWGQDLPGLARWLQTHTQRDENVYVSYAGSGNLEHEGIRADELAPIYNFDRPRRWYDLGPGLYCIGATMLQDTYGGYRGDWTLEKERSYLALRNLAGKAPPPTNAQEAQTRANYLYELDRLRFARLCFYLRVRQPEAVIGYSIFIHRLTAEEVRIVQNGSLTELAQAMEKALQARTP